VVTVSNRAWAGVYADRGGPLIVDGLRELGFAVDGPVVVQDGDPVEEALRSGVGSGYDVIVTTGGTGLTRDPDPGDDPPSRRPRCPASPKRSARPVPRFRPPRCPVPLPG
jgi:hypothetical protein